MRRYLPSLMLLLGALALAGCPGKHEKPADITKTQRDALEKATGVEKEIDAATRRRMEEAEKP